MLLFLSLTQFMGAVTILLVKIAFKTYLSSLSLILTWPIRSELFTCALIHGGQFTGGGRPPNKFVPEIVSPLPCSSYITECFFFLFSRNSSLSSPPLPNATPAFSTL